MNGPIRGTLFEDEIHTNGTLLEYRSFYNLAVEAEMAFEIGENNQIISVFPIIELHNFVFRGPKKTLSELIANNGLNKGFILSEKRWRRAPCSRKNKFNSMLFQLGDVIVEGTNLYGEGVNNAARLEVLSQPGGVSLSETIYDFANKKVELEFNDLGTQKVKNTVLRAYDIILDGLETRVLGSSNETVEVAESKPPTIAVLPFKNMRCIVDLLISKKIIHCD